jgi:hypothetical protein
VQSPEHTLIAINHVRADRADAFAQWLRSVVTPAIRDHQPHLSDRWRVLRGTETEDGEVVFAFLFDGGTDDDWDLSSLLEKALGPEDSERALADMHQMLMQDQYGWWFAPVRLDGPDSSAQFS